MNSFLTATEVLKCGFSYVYYPSDKIFHRKINGIQEYSVANNMLFVKDVWVYDIELDGEINVKYELFKTKRKKWILLKRHQIIELFAVQSLIEETNSKFDDTIKFIYIIKSDFGYKIGRTKKIESRYRTFNVKLPFDWHFLKVFPVNKNKVNKIEKFLHNQLGDKNMNGEWFILNDNDIILISNFIEQVTFCL